jgi:hypothetical protein
MSNTTSTAAEGPISLSANGRLTDVNFEISDDFECEWIMESLLSISSPHLEEVRFTIDGEAEYSDEVMDWVTLDAILAGQQFSKLTRVVIALHAWKGHRLFASLLPQCHSRGVLIVMDVDLMLWDI